VWLDPARCVSRISRRSRRGSRHKIQTSQAPPLLPKPWMSFVDRPERGHHPSCIRRRVVLSRPLGFGNSSVRPRHKGGFATVPGKPSDTRKIALSLAPARHARESGTRRAASSPPKCLLQHTVPPATHHPHCSLVENGASAVSYPQPSVGGPASWTNVIRSVCLGVMPVEASIERPSECERPEADAWRSVWACPAPRQHL